MPAQAVPVPAAARGKDAPVKFAHIEFRTTRKQEMVRLLLGLSRRMSPHSEPTFGKLPVDGAADRKWVHTAAAFARPHEDPIPWSGPTGRWKPSTMRIQAASISSSSSM